MTVEPKKQTEHARTQQIHVDDMRALTRILTCINTFLNGVVDIAYILW